MRTQIVSFALVLSATGAASAQQDVLKDISKQVGPQIGGPLFKSVATRTYGPDSKYVFAETGSPSDVKTWEHDLIEAKKYGVPSLEISGPFLANGRVGVLRPRLEGVTGDPLSVGNTDAIQRYKDYANPEVTLADLRKIEEGMQSARDHGVPIFFGGLEIDASGHVHVPYVERLHVPTNGDVDGLPMPVDLRKASGPLDHEAKVLASIRAEIRNVRLASGVLQDKGIEALDSKKAVALAARMLGEMQDVTKHVEYAADRPKPDPARPDYVDATESAAEDGAAQLAHLLRPTYNPAGLEVAARDWILSFFNEREQLRQHGPVVGGLTVMEKRNGKKARETFLYYKDGHTEFDSSGTATEWFQSEFEPWAPWGTARKRVGNLDDYKSTEDEARRLAAAMPKLRGLPAPTLAEQTIPPGEPTFYVDFQDETGKSQSYKVNEAYLSAHQDSFLDFVRLARQITEKVDPVKATGMTQTLDKIK
jgi:hypothetical protein